jgi:hypothetical protein
MWKDAAKKTIVPPTEFRIDGVVKYNAMRVMTTALPNLQPLRIEHPGYRHKYNDGEDPDEDEVGRTANDATHDIDIISRCSKLRFLEIWGAPLNGRYPILFIFPLLIKLTIWEESNLKWGLEMLEGLHLLTDLHCINIPHLTGNLSSLRVLKDTLKFVKIVTCGEIMGNLMDLADFPRLKVLWLTLQRNNVTGDIRDVGEYDFPALESLTLPDTVYGSRCYEFQSIAEVSEFMSRIYLFAKRHKKLFEFCYWRLSEDSPDWYDVLNGDEDQIPPPFEIEFIIIPGSRIGWRWKSTYYTYDELTISCEINWLEPEPDRGSSGYEDYILKLDALKEEIDFYRGFNQPPTAEEYHRLCENLRCRNRRYSGYW